jgi:hypothetical protein
MSKRWFHVASLASALFLAMYYLPVLELNHAQSFARVIDSGNPSEPKGDLIRVSELKPLETEGQFHAALKEEWAMLFFWDINSTYTRHSQEVVSSWVRKRQPPFRVYRVAAYEQAYVWKWLADQNREELAFRCHGSLVWLRRGVIIAEQPDPAQGGEEQLQQLTVKALEQGH